MNQLDSNRFNTFGNESDRNTICSTQRARKPPSMHKYSSEPTSQREATALASTEVQSQKPDFVTCHTETSENSQVGNPDDFDLKEHLMKGITSPNEGQMLGTLDLKQFEMDKSMENTFKTALSKLTSGNATMKEDFKNTLSLMFPCDYFIPASGGNSGSYNKTILEVSETDKENILERQNVSKILAEAMKKQPLAHKKRGENLDVEEYQEALQNMKHFAIKEETLSDQFTGPDAHSTRRTKATEESEMRNPSERADLMNEFKGLKKEVVAIQKDLRVSDDYNKKLEEHIYQQSCQIMQILKNFNILNEENGLLKQQLAGALKKNASKDNEKLSRVQTGKYDHIDHVIAKKSNRVLNEEILYLKARHEKIIRNHENIIQDLQIQLRHKDLELEDLKKHNREENETRALNELFLFQPKRSLAENRKSDHELHSLREGHGIDIKRSGFYTPNRMRPLNELKPSDSHEKHYDVKTSKSTRNMGDITSTSSASYHKQAKEFIKDLQKSKGRDKENIPRDSYTGGKGLDGKAPLAKSGSQLTPTHYQGELTSSKNRERSGSTSKMQKEGKDSSQGWNEKGLHHEQFNMQKIKEKRRENDKDKILPQMSHEVEDYISEDESKKSLADISFDISYLKENIDKRLESELTSLNISPAKEKEGKNKSSQRQHKKPIHNHSQFNEISVINEQPSENFITDSIHTKLISELQSHPESTKKARPEEIESNYMKAPKEYSSSRARGEEYFEKRNSHAGGMTPKEYPGHNYDHSMKGREHYNSSRREKENLEQYQASHSRRHKKDGGEEKSGEAYKRSKSSEKPVKAHLLQGSHRLPSDASEERKPRKEETTLERGYREYLKELADKTKKQQKSESHMHSNTHEKSSRHGHNKSRERSSHHDRHHQAEKQAAHQTHNDTIVTLNMALEKMLEKDSEKGGHRPSKNRSTRHDENERHEGMHEQDDLQLEYRSRSSGHRKKSGTPSSNLQLQGPTQSSKTISSRLEAPEPNFRKTYDKNYDRISEGEYHLPSGPVTNKSSRKQFYGIKEDLNNFNSCDAEAIAAAQTGIHSGKPRLDPSRSGSTKSATPTGTNKPQIYNMRGESASQSQTNLGRDSKSSRRSHQNIHPEPMVRNMNSFEHGPSTNISSGTGRNSSVGHSKSGSGTNKGDSKHTYHSTKYQMGPYNDISIVDYKYPDEIRNDDGRAQHSTNDFVNFDSVLHHEKEGTGGIYRSNNSSFVLFHNTNLDSINSSTVFEAFPTKKSIHQKDNSKTYGGHSTKYVKHL